MISMNKKVHEAAISFLMIMREVTLIAAMQLYLYSFSQFSFKTRFS